ncbi:hypothetical protein EV363DRAFT_1319687 [Boletus edulis]|nr:hypothetical protein EV363DRAFT_1319687 [Boletus edulis]
MGVSLWLVPTAAQMDKIKSILPRRPSGDHLLSPSSYPAFPPHITLATAPLSDPGIPNVLLDAVPVSQQPIRANFQSLVVVQSTHDLVDLQNQIRINLRRRGLEPTAPRFPHMSLCYIADEDKSHRDRTAQALRDTGVVVSGETTGDMQSISLQCGDVHLLGFDGTEIWLVKCEGPVETWQVDERRVKLSPNL